MAFDWNLFYTLAEVMQTGDREEILRTAISRAYYAAFHAAEKKYAENHQIAVTLDGGYSHHDVWNWYRGSYRKISEDGFRLKASRVKADYADDFPGLPEQTKYSLARAKSIIEAVAKIP